MASTTEESSPAKTATEIDLIGTARRRWPNIIFGVAVGVTLAAMYYFATTPMYESQVEILVGQRSSEVTNNGTITGAGASGDAIQEDQLATHMRLFVGRKRLAEAIQAGELDKLDSFRDALASGKSLIDHILDNIEVKRGGEGSASDAMVLRATFRDPNPEDAALVLSAIYDSYRNYVESHGQNSTEQAVELIEEARRTHEVELTAADRAYREFVESIPVLVDGRKVQDVHQDRLANLESELNVVRTALAESTSRLEVIEHYLANRVGTSVAATDHLALLSQKEVERLKLFLDVTRGEAQSEAFQAEQPMRQEVAKAQYNRLLDLIQREQAFSDAFGPGHPMVEAVRQETEITRRFIEANAPEPAPPKSTKLDPADMLETYTQLLRNDIAELEKRRDFLMSESEREFQLAKQIESDLMKGNALQAQLRRAQSRYDEVILRLQELNLARSYAGFSTDVLASPEVAKNAAWPNLPIVGSLGILFGLGIGFVLALGSELLDSTFGNVSELERSVGAPAIAHVPRFNPADLHQDDSASRLDPSLVTFHAPRSAESEVYRVARTSLMLANRKGSMQTIMMTSPQPGDGKSTTISNLAISFARTGKKVLLIDGDLRRPMISRLFGVEEEPGLADVLMGRASMSKAIRTSEVPGLHIMPNGSPTSVPAELLESHRLAKILRTAAGAYDLVLIDAPPLLAVADPAIIAPMVDSVLLTVCVHKNGRRPVEHAVRILADVDIQPAAVIVNGLQRDSKGTYGYGSYSREQYGYIGQYHRRYAAVEAPVQAPIDAPRDDGQRSNKQPHQRTDRGHPTTIPTVALTHTDATNQTHHSL